MSKIKEKAEGFLIDEVTGKKIKASTAFVNGKLFIHIDGYGDMCSYDGEGEVVGIDFFNDKLQVLVWSDINQEDPTHRIDLHNAREENRAELDNDGNCIYCGKKCYIGQMCDEQQAGGFDIEDHNKAMMSQDDD